jgi:hypothetical protein
MDKQLVFAFNSLTGRQWVRFIREGSKAYSSLPPDNDFSKLELWDSTIWSSLIASKSAGEGGITEIDGGLTGCEISHWPTMVVESSWSKWKSGLMEKLNGREQAWYLTNQFGCNRYRMIRHKHGKNVSLTVCDRGEKKYGRWERAKETLSRCQEEVADASIFERKVLVRSFQDLALKVHKEAFVAV